MAADQNLIPGVPLSSYSAGRWGALPTPYIRSRRSTDKTLVFCAPARTWRYAGNVAILAEGKADGVTPKKVAARAVAVVGMKSKAAKLTAEAMVRNLTIAERLGWLDSDGLGESRIGEGSRPGGLIGGTLSLVASLAFSRLIRPRLLR